MRILVVLIMIAISFSGYSQTADSYYHKAAGDYIHEKSAVEVKQTIDDGLRRFPTDKKLNELKKFIKDEEKKKQDQQNKDQKDKQDQKDKKDQQDKDKQDQQQKDQKDKQDQKDKEQKEKEQKQREQQQKEEQKNKPDPSLSDKLKDMKISEEKAKMILEAMKHQEVQYLQQNKRKATKPKDKGKPDWWS